MKLNTPKRIALFVIIAVAVARELGWVSLNLQRTGSISQVTTTTHDLGDRSGGWALDIVDASASEDNTVLAGDSDANESNIPNAVGTYRGEITEFELSGAYWLPLFKSGEVAYKARITRNRKEVGDMSGTIQMKTKGLCSAYEFRRMAREAVEDAIRNSIEERLRQ